MENLQQVGKQTLGEVFSFVFPNRFASQQENELKLENLAVVVAKKPILFNIKLLKGEPLLESDDETVFMT